MIDSNNNWHASQHEQKQNHNEAITAMKHRIMKLDLMNGVCILILLLQQIRVLLLLSLIVCLSVVRMLIRVLTHHAAKCYFAMSVSSSEEGKAFKHNDNEMMLLFKKSCTMEESCKRCVLIW